MWILGEYCSTKEDIQSVMTEVRRSLGEVCMRQHLGIPLVSEATNGWVPFGQIPIVENEIKKETGEVKPEDEVSAAPAQKLVTEMGTYVTQSALSSSRPSKKEEDR